MSLVDAVDGSSSGTSVPWMWALLKPIQTITAIGLDIAKSVFQVHGLVPAARWSFAASSSVATS